MTPDSPFLLVLAKFYVGLVLALVALLIVFDQELVGFEDELGPAMLGTPARAHLLLRVWCDPLLRAAAFGA